MANSIVKNPVPFVILYSLLKTFTCATRDSFGTGRVELGAIPSVFPSGSRHVPPGLHEPTKAWWAKEITPFFHVCGRLSERQIKYAAEAGFKSILSLFPYPDDCPGDCGGEYLPVTTEERSIVEDIAKLQFIPLLGPLDEWASVEAVEKFTAEISKIEKPALLHCDRGYTITFVVLLYLANQTRYDPNFEPRIHTKEFYEISASMGLDFLSRIPVEIVSEVTGEAKINIKNLTVPRPHFHPVEWLDFWFAHPVYYNWFSAGQIYQSHMAPLKDFGYESVLNVRSGAFYNGKANQEEVNLLNIKSKTGTYGDSKTPWRQSVERLEATRINSSQPNVFISDSSTANYELRNEHEFGDDVGYNETLERIAVEKSGLRYFHIPLHDSMDDFPSYIAENRYTLLEIGNKGPVLIHCDSGHRSAMVSVLVAALQYDLSLDWALQRLKEMGYGISSKSQPQIFNVYKQYLAENKRVEL
ncbi:beta-lactamase hydrolase-like protein [Plakobranchus ocellatus]|uniref:Beta-lactamase hydrolase-like protein n=1 Tax=Plakobranchus ocellatus TaxID=259542 RepID=A0AAV4DFM5_9GAST|nr:beta-lactamase hydrolase-like protein [Plakobranchus ocellatus]